MSKWTIEQLLEAAQENAAESDLRQAELDAAYTSLTEEIAMNDFTEQVQNFRALVGAGIFGCTFEKRNGDMRSGSFRFGVQKDLTGAGSSYDRDARGNITVYDMNKEGYRTIRLESIKTITVRGVTVAVTHNREEG